MYKLFSIEQANSLIPQVDSAVSELKQVSEDLRRTGSQLRESEPWTLEARNLYFESVFLAQQAQSLKKQIENLGVRVADPKTGKLGFPAQVGAELVWLTWEPGEDTVTHFRRMAGTSSASIPLSPQGEPVPESASA
ncbi:MAG TPA: DUF2203 family protein [Deinococcales bacterium]|nr:DUF2203 family protein [Deinococcales bacterium]